MFKTIKIQIYPNKGQLNIINSTLDVVDLLRIIISLIILIDIIMVINLLQLQNLIIL